MEFISGSLFIRPMKLFEPGEMIKGHKHSFDHTSIFFTGKWNAKKWSPDGDHLLHDIEFDAPFHLLIEAECQHEFTYLGGAERGVAWCVYSHRTSQGEISTEWNGWLPAYL